MFNANLVPHNATLCRSGYSTWAVRSFLVGLITVWMMAASPAEAITLSESFMGSTAPNWVLGGNAQLTAAAGIDLPGDGWLRLTDNTANQAGYAYFNTPFDASRGLDISFEYADWGGTGADGISVFLFDATTPTFTIGASGGSLAYAQKTVAPISDGVSNGYLGVGIDEFGNFQSPTEGRVGGPGIRVNSVAVRGAGNGRSGTDYPYLGGTAANIGAAMGCPAPTCTTRPSQAGTYYRKIQVIISPTGAVTVYMQFGAGQAMQTLLSNLANPAAKPTSLKLGFAASTGGSTNYHEVRNISITPLEAPTIFKAFSPTSIVSGQTSQMVFTLTNPNSVPLSGGGFTDTLVNMRINAAGAAGGTCAGAAGNSFAAGQTALTFSGLTLPAAGSCTVTAVVTSTTAGTKPNTTSGVTTNLIPTAGPVSNTANLQVGEINVVKSFNPTTIAVNGTADLIFTLENRTGANQTAITFRDLFPTTPAAMIVATPLTTSNSCGGTLRNYGSSANLAINDTGMRLINGTLTNNSICTITIKVKIGAIAGTYSNTATNIDYAGHGAAYNSNTASLTAATLTMPIISKGFSPNAIDVYDPSTLTFTLTNPNVTTLTNVNFTDILTGFYVLTPVIGGTCASVTSSPALVAGATNLNLTAPFLQTGNCIITIPVTGSVASPVGTPYPNTASGVTTTETGITVGTPSNTATLAVNFLPMQVTKAPNVTMQNPGGIVDYVIGYRNPNASTPLKTIVITDPIPVYTTYLSASCGLPLPSALSSCTISAPPVGGTGTVIWTLGGDLNAGSSGTVNLSVRIK